MKLRGPPSWGQSLDPSHWPYRPASSATFPAATSRAREDFTKMKMQSSRRISDWPPKNSELVFYRTDSQTCPGPHVCKRKDTSEIQHLRIQAACFPGATCAGNRIAFVKWCLAPALRAEVRQAAGRLVLAFAICVFLPLLPCVCRSLQQPQGRETKRQMNLPREGI